MRGPSSAAALAPSRQVVGCRVAGRSYAFDGNDVRFIVRSDQVVAGGGGIACVGTLKGPDPIPVYSVAALLHPSADADGGAHVIVTGGGSRVGWQVERILRGGRDDAHEVLSLPALAGPVARRWFAGLMTQGDDEPSLLCSPSGLDPRARACLALPDPTPPKIALSSSGTAHGVVALFSSPALPRCVAQRYAISGRRIVAVAQSLAGRVVPGTPSYIVGLAAWRGIAVPLLDLSGRTSAAVDGSSGRYLLVRHGTGAQATVVGLAIDRDVVLHQASHADTPLASPGSVVPPGIRLFRVKEEPIAFLDLDVLMGLRVASALGDPAGTATAHW